MTRGRFAILFCCMVMCFCGNGVAQIALNVNIDHFLQRYALDAASLAVIVSGLGIGRCVGYPVMGTLSDRIGRKPVVIFGVLTQAVFFAGLFLTESADAAFFLSVLCGFASASIDAGCWPAIVDADPQSASWASVAVKTSMSIGQMVFPLLLGVFVQTEGGRYLYTALALVLAVNAVVIFFLPFAKKPEKDAQAANTDGLGIRIWQAARRVAADWPVFGYAFFAYAGFSLVLLWLPLYARVVAGAGVEQSLDCAAMFALGSVLFGFVLMWLLQAFANPAVMMAVIPSAGIVAGITGTLWPDPVVCQVVGFAVGAACGSGIMQVGMALLAQRHPGSRGAMASLYMMFGAVSSVVVVNLSGVLVSMHPEMLLSFSSQN